LLLALLVGGLAAVPTGLTAPWQFTPLIGWDTAALVFVGGVWLSIMRLDASGTARLAVREDPTTAMTDALLISAAVASLLSVGLVLARAGNQHGALELAQVALAVASVILSWAVVHTVFTLKYARLYYTGPDGGVNFHTDEKPGYTDFAYVAFTIGMTFQVSDTDLQTRALRITALGHALLSYLFGTVIVATTINLIAGLGR
jgi:uncharacterized membrane protein